MQISTLSVYILVRTLSTGKGRIDAVLGIDPKPVGRSGIPASQGSTLFVPYTDSWRRPFQRGCRHVKVPIFGLGNIVGTGDVGPHGDELAFQRENLHAAILPVSDLKPTLLHESVDCVALAEHGGDRTGVLAQQCLDRRIPDQNILRSEVAAWQAERNQAEIRVDRRFTTADARIKLKSLYPSLQS